MRSIRGIIPIFAFCILLSCSRQAEQVSAVETADQIEEAGIAGRNEAKKIVTKNFKDTLELQSCLLEARSVSSKYDIDGEPKCKAAFDSAFISTIRTVRPDLAKELEKPSESDR